MVLIGHLTAVLFFNSKAIEPSINVQASLLLAVVSNTLPQA